MLTRAYSRADLSRRLTRANERLRNARRDGNYADIVKWRTKRDELLEQWIAASQGPQATQAPSGEPDTEPSTPETLGR
jgi:hypothetical protein